MLKAPVLFLILIVAFGSAWSSEPEKINANAGDRTAKYEQRGTENSPIFIHGEVTAKKNEEEAREDAEDRKIKADSDAALVEYTGMLAIFTCLLFVFTAALWLVTFQLSRDARKTSDRQASEMEKALAIAQESADAAKKSADVAEHALTNIERPYIYVSDVGWKWDASNKVVVAFTVANYGKLPGAIQNVRATLGTTSSGTPEIPRCVDESNPLLLFPIIAAGEERKQVEIMGNPSDISISAFSPEGNDDLFFWIIISYQGPLSAKDHESSFCWRLSRNPQSYLKFIPFRQEGYNYAK